MTDERGSVTWSATYYPFGEMTAGSNNTHGFTGKEYDSEMGLNYFCQRYYDPEIGRFMTLDTWSNLPDDERLFSYEKYLSWNNHEIKYTPMTNNRIIYYRSQYHDDNYTYDTLNNAFISAYDISRTYQFIEKDRSLMTLYDFPMYNNRTYPVLSYNHQLNCYMYCLNNPLCYVDPLGRGQQAVARWISCVGGGAVGGYYGVLLGAAVGGLAGGFGAIAGGFIGGGVGGYYGSQWGGQAFDWLSNFP